MVDAPAAGRADQPPACPARRRAARARRPERALLDGLERQIVTTPGIEATRGGVSVATRAAAAFRLAGPLALGLALLALVCVYALTQGAASIPARTAVAFALDRLPWVTLTPDAPATWQRIIVDVRLPRVAAAVIVGAALSGSGAAYQGVFRNPLADPFLLGIASGAALGASLAIVSPLPIDSYGFGWVPASAFLGALATVVLVTILARSGGDVDGVSLILAGVALSSICSAISSFILLTGGQKAQPIFAFIFGGLNTVSWTRVAIALPYVLGGTLVLAVTSRALDVLQLDEEQAEHLGLNVARTKVIVLAAASLMAAAAVAVAGIIGFVGLMVPHAVRLAWGGGFRRLLPLSLIYGAAFLVLVDTFARTTIAPQEVPLGIITAFIGGPAFLVLMRRRRRWVL
ncbi:MAG: iron ABC transporter permease [Dehalococcoidia bacterium]|nr:MAG: iron ABC transporter permease [Dehalococcoidia bacterium]